MAFTVPVFWRIFGLSLTAVPVTIFANKLLKYFMAIGLHSTFIALIGLFVFGGFIGLAYWTCQASLAKKNIKNRYFYVFCLFAFTAIIDLGLALELNGYITDFISEYLQSGEPYLFSTYGGIICLLDGTIMYSMYLYMVHAISNNVSYRKVGLYWSGFILNSMIVLFVAILWGKHGVFPSTALNIPYIVLPIVIACDLLSERPKLQTSERQKPLAQRPLDIFFIVFLVFLCFITVLRAVAVTENNVGVAKFYSKDIEPFILHNDPCPFIKSQIFMNLYYLLPVYLLSIHALLSPGCSWMTDLTLIHAGASAQGQLSHIITALHNEIPHQFQIPQSSIAVVGFWLVNLLITVIPHLLLIRCLISPSFFSLQVKGKSTRFRN